MYNRIVGINHVDIVYTIYLFLFFIFIFVEFQLHLKCAYDKNNMSYLLKLDVKFVNTVWKYFKFFHLARDVCNWQVFWFEGAYLPCWTEFYMYYHTVIKIIDHSEVGPTLVERLWTLKQNLY